MNTVTNWTLEILARNADLLELLVRIAGNSLLA